MKAADAQAAACTSAIGKRLEVLEGKFAATGRQLEHSRTVPILAIGAVAVKSFTDFDAKIRMLQTQAGATGAEMKKMQKAALSMHGLEEGPTQIADALFHAESAGIRSAKALALVHKAAQGAA